MANLPHRTPPAIDDGAKGINLPEPAVSARDTESCATDSCVLPGAAGKGQHKKSPAPATETVGSSLAEGAGHAGDLLSCACDIELHLWVPPMTGAALRRHYLGLFEDVTAAGSVNGGFVGEGWVVIVRSQPAKLDNDGNEVVGARTAREHLSHVVGVLRAEAEHQKGPKGRAAAAGFQVLRDALHRLEEKQ